MASPDLSDALSARARTGEAIELEHRVRVETDLARIERKLDEFAVMLEEFRPLLEAAKARLERPRWGGARGNQNRT